MERILLTEAISALKHSFRLLLGEGHVVDRFVYSYILFDEKIWMIDTGTRPTSSLLWESLHARGRDPGEVSLVLLTHAHPDHIGGCSAIKNVSSTSFGAHPADRPWIEDVEKQHRERPIPNFYELVEGPVPVTVELKEGVVLSWGATRTLRVLETPGHSLGSISLFCEEEGILFSGDAVPAEGTFPIYVDPRASIQSIQKLKKVSGVKQLLSSWHEPLSGNRITDTLDEGIRYIEKIDRIVDDLMKTAVAEMSGEELTLRALGRLGIKTHRVLSMVRTSIESHRQGV